jgi:hypothetical protein
MMMEGRYDIASRNMTTAKRKQRSINFMHDTAKLSLHHVNGSRGLGPEKPSGKETITGSDRKRLHHLNLSPSNYNTKDPQHTLDKSQRSSRAGVI